MKYLNAPTSAIERYVVERARARAHFSVAVVYDMPLWVMSLELAWLSLERNDTFITAKLQHPNKPLSNTLLQCTPKSATIYRVGQHFMTYPLMVNYFNDSISFFHVNACCWN